MLGHVLQRLQRAEVDGALRVLRVAADLIRLDLHRYRAPGRLRVQGHDQAAFGQQRRVDAAGQGAQVVQRRAELCLQVGDRLPEEVWVVGRFGQQAELDGQRDQLLLRAVVQVPLDLAPFCILGFHQPAPG